MKILNNIFLTTLHCLYLQSADAAYQRYIQRNYGNKAGGAAFSPQYLQAQVVSLNYYF